MSGKETRADKELGLTGMCFGGQDHCEINKTRQRVEASRVLGNRQNRMFNIENNF
jgi:hypothetical protein